LHTVAHALPDGEVKIWNAETGESTGLKTGQRFNELLALSPDGRTLVTGGRRMGGRGFPGEGRGFGNEGPGVSLRWWDLETGTNVAVETDAYRIIFSPDGKTAAALATGNQVEIWEVASRTLRTNFVMEVMPGFEAAFSPDTRLLAIVCFDDSVRIYDTASGEHVGTCTGHKQAVFSVAFAPDGKTLATASDDCTLKLWNVHTQQELLSLRRLGGALRSIVFSPDGKLLVVERSSSTAANGLCFYRAPLFKEIEAATEGHNSPEN
jgi:WD40 repeat protein